MKLLFDLNSLRPPRSGVGYYTQHLLEGLLQAPGVSDVAGWTGRTVLRGDALRALVAASPDAQAEGQASRRDGHGRALQVVQKLRALPGLYGLRTMARGAASYGLRRSFARDGYLYHETNSVASRYAGKSVVTIHDLSHRRHPEFHPQSAVDYLERGLPPTFEQADVVIADSAYTRKELIDLYGLDARKIVVVHLGVDASFRPWPLETCAPVLAKLGIEARRFVLSVCTLQPRKNLLRLVQGFARLPSAMRRAFPLVLVGADGWDNSALNREIAPLVKAREIIPAGYVSRSDLLRLFASATVFAYPSLYEGFGLPVAEAMASGVPVLTSHVTSIPEVAAGAALEVDPYAVDEITDGLARLLDDERLRSDLIAKGLRRASELTWEETVRQTCEVYRRVAA